jgi:hypothetical protein
MQITAPAQSCESPLALLSSPPSNGNRFLVEGPSGAVLHTGDIRAEPGMIHDLSRNPHVQKYLGGQGRATDNHPLEAIYIDTASFFGASDMPSKVTKSVVYRKLF